MSVNTDVADSAVDVLVIGAGLAGSMAAARAASLGCSVALVDTAPDPSAGGNTRLSGGSIHVAGVPLTTAPADILAHIVDVTHGTARPELAAALAEHCGRALAWSMWHGVEVEPPTPEDEWRTILAPMRTFDDVHSWPGRGPQRTLQILQATVRRLGGQVTESTRIQELLRSEATVIGGVTDRGLRIEARNVVLADGGFQSDPELRQRHIGPAANRIFMRGAPSGRGDGLRMGLEAGATTVNMAGFYGHCLHRDSLTNDRLWPMPLLDDLLVDAILVGPDGRRFVDESMGGIAAANAGAKTSDPRSLWIVIDEAGWEAVEGHSGGTGQPAANPEIELRGGTIHWAESAEELARLIRLDERTLVSTIAEYSDAAARGHLPEVSVPRKAGGRPLKPPFLAIPTIPGITFTTGGLLTDASTRVLGPDERPITGLYAAGGTAGGLQDGAAGTYVGGLAPALVFGLLAGEAVARS
jgi:fumarate reductase flavoprotein subunit